MTALYLNCCALWFAEGFRAFFSANQEQTQTNHVTCSHAFSRRTVTRGTHQLQDLIGSFECLLVSWLIISIAKVLLLRCSFENSPNIWSLHYSCRFIVSDQPDAHRVNTRSLWPWSDRPHSIVSAVCGDKNVYYKWFHDWGTRHTRKTHPYRGKRLWYLLRFKVWYFQSGVWSRIVSLSVVFWMSRNVPPKEERCVTSKTRCEVD